MDCQTFDSSLLDALYDELDAPTSAAMDEHAVGCSSCATNIARLKKTQELFRPALESPLPEGLEDRILAAAEAAMDATTGATAKPNHPPVSTGDVVQLADRRRAQTGVVAFLSRPQFAIAATFLLVLGAAAVLINTSAKREAPSAAAMAEPLPREAASVAAADQNQASPPVAAATAAAPMGSTYAMAPPPSPAPDNLAESAGPSAKAGRARGGASPGDGDRADNSPAAPTLTAARSLYDAGRYAEALPRFDALAPTSAEAELYAARCLVNTKGCAAAVPRFDSAARRSAGTENGSRAALEAARCVNRTGQTTAARARYKGLTNDNYVATEANAELEAIDAPKAAMPAQRPPAPQATATSVPAQATPPANNNTRR